jgi:hypothetical protein
MKPTEVPSPVSAPTRAAKGPSKAQQAFQRGPAVLAQWVEREGAHRPVPRGHAEEIAVEGQEQPMEHRLGVWLTNTKARRDKLTADQLAALAELGVEWA